MNLVVRDVRHLDERVGSKLEFGGQVQGGGHRCLGIRCGGRMYHMKRGDFVGANLNGLGGMDIRQYTR